MLFRYKENEDMILTTTHDVEGHQIKAYLGVVAGEAILGTNFFKDFLQIFVILLVADRGLTKRNCDVRGKLPFRKFRKKP